MITIYTYTTSFLSLDLKKLGGDIGLKNTLQPVGRNTITNFIRIGRIVPEEYKQIKTQDFYILNIYK